MGVVRFGSFHERPFGLTKSNIINNTTQKPTTQKTTPQKPTTAIMVTQVQQNQESTATSTTTANNNNNQSLSTKEWVQQLVSSHKVVVFSKTYCPFCHRTKQTFRHLKTADVVVVEIDAQDNGGEIQRILYGMTGQLTVPSVWINGTFLGGNDDTQAALRSGQLEKMLKQ